MTFSIVIMVGRGYFLPTHVHEASKYIREQIYSIIVNSPCSEKYKVPYELMAEHYSNTIQMLLEWCFIRDKNLSEDDALSALHYLLEGL